MEATCFCKSITIRVDSPDGKKPSVYVCHCNDCKMVSGSAFSMSAAVKKELVSFVKGEDNLTSYEETTSRRNKAKYFFCQTCGTGFKTEHEAVEKYGMVLVSMGNFQTTDEPVEEFYTIRRCPWIPATSSTQHKTMPGEEDAPGQT